VQGRSPGREFFELVDGEVHVARKGRRVATLGAGDFVGEISPVEPAPRTATVTARTPLRLFVLTPRDFQQMLDQNPKVERKIMRASPDASWSSRATRSSPDRQRHVR
jgi:CRP/FNR family cyclic AMP-dependent transcriptional regulator